MYSKVFSLKKVLLSLTMTSLIACSGGGSDFVPDAAINSGMYGDWTLNFVITDTNCQDLGIEEGNDGSSTTDALNISEGGCSFIGLYDEDVAAYNCLAGDTNIEIVGDIAFDIGESNEESCSYAIDETIQMAYNIEDSSLTGTYTTKVSFSGSSCASLHGGKSSFSCSVTAAVTGELSSIEEPLSPDIIDEEVCDGIDNDNDGEIDEGLLKTYYLDVDGDGYADESVTTEDCAAPEGYIETSLGQDCNDSDANINPGMVELIGNGLDDDCDSITDEKPDLGIDPDATITPKIPELPTPHTFKGIKTSSTEDEIDILSEHFGVEKP